MYTNVALSVLWYGAPVWAHATKVAYRRREIEKGCAEMCMCLPHCFHGSSLHINTYAADMTCLQKNVQRYIG